MTPRHFLLGLLLLLAPVAQAVEPREMLADPALEARAREVSKALRCVVCPSESIDESNAEIAHDMRVLVRKRIVAGESNAQVIAYMHDRYGDYVLLKPRFTAATALLWCGPVLVLLLGFLAVRRRWHAPAAAAPLSDAETATLAALQDREANAP